MRIDWQRYALLLAWTASLRSEALSDAGPRKVGCCVLAKDSCHVLSLGYNGFQPGFIAPVDFYKDRVKRVTHIIHAECNALTGIGRGQAGILATTLSPCVACAQQMIARQIPTVVYGEEYLKDQDGLDILRFYNVEVIYMPIKKVLDEWVTPALCNLKV